MTFNSDTEAIEQPQKVHAVEFDVRGVVSRFTSARRPLIIAGQTYAPGRIKVNASKTSSKTVKRTIEIETSIDETTQAYVANAVPATTKIKVMEVYVETNNCRTIFSGRLIRVTLTAPGSAKITAEGGTTQFREEFNGLSFSSDCNNDLFDERCGLQESDYETIVNVASVSGNTITGLQLAAPVFPLDRNPDPSQLAEWWIGGFIMLDDETDIRMITEYDGGTSIELQFPFDSRVTPGVRLKAFPGCRKDAPTCLAKFQNVNPGGFLGFPYVPNTNPVIFSIDRG